MKKRIYRKTLVEDLPAEQLIALLPEPLVVVAIDVAKHDMVAVFAAREAGVVITVAWSHPTQSSAFLELLAALQGVGKIVHAVMEPSGTYGDALRFQLGQHGIPVFCMSTKRAHDAAEIFDSVPSMHDAKAAAIIARLHLQGLSVPWVEPKAPRRLFL